MKQEIKVILIGNYLSDKQESMIRFTKALHAGFNDSGIPTTTWWPTAFLGKYVKSTTGGLGKWLGYIDKYLFFPFVIRYRLKFSADVKNPDVRFHVCDHSNAPYLKYLPKNSTGITCHDVIAIRGALGYEDASAPISGMGKHQQNWILSHLSKARLIACDSQCTLDQLREVSIPGSTAEQKDWRVIHVSFNAKFWPMPINEAVPLLSNVGIVAGQKFILHVGSSHVRKNRNMLLDMVSELGNRWNGIICFAGEPLDEGLLAKAEQLGLRDRVIAAVKISHETLVALYSSCEVFIFPSLSEGFGWPVIEAQACGAPVIASNYAPMPEVSGGAAIHVDPKNAKEFADAFLSLQNKEVKESVIAEGYKNTLNFTPEKMIRSYVDLYNFE